MPFGNDLIDGPLPVVPLSRVARHERIEGPARFLHPTDEERDPFGLLTFVELLEAVAGGTERLSLGSARTPTKSCRLNQRAKDAGRKPMIIAQISCYTNICSYKI
jgi:hypothetical protein